ncbi:flagellar basal body P-ring formation chaperone FlgA [Pararhodospirillum oryzae]|uniref:Flagellar basal body P-ring biosynthesis protein FlgA n=1 Tax=Pararhodospirillum oryzae TaxID=478448 RepID=A0A512H8L0_9PROT|nr:flagellar basal body P-ring formation chaperone FlgA [Pararhodospirillum oryzae]GEO81793.1 flagellar basal body P-ring biosynthesis protein FlgA [Pararhodospirillum oryzae]
MSRFVSRVWSRRCLGAVLVAATAGLGGPLGRAAEAPANLVPPQPTLMAPPRADTPVGMRNGPAESLALAPGEIELRRAIEVNGPFVTLGDLFEGVGPLAGVAVARAPRPGRSATLDTEWLEQAAQANGLAWAPRGPFDQTVVTRPGVTVPLEAIEATLRPVMANLGAPDSMTMEITTARSSLSVPPGEPYTIRVTEETFDPVTRRFSAVLEAPAGAPDAQRVTVAGRFNETREVPVLLRRLGREETIRAEDLTTMRVRADTLPPDVITDAADLVGMETRSVARDGQPLRRADVVRPVLLRKDTLVTMELRMPGMILSARGRALEAGGMGDMVRVANLTSRQVVMAEVVGPNRVVVAPPPVAVRPQTASR